MVVVKIDLNSGKIHSVYMSSIQRLSGALLRVHNVLPIIGRNNVRIVPIHSIMYINVYTRCLDVQYNNNQVDSLHFSTDKERDNAILIVAGECIVEKKVPLISDYPFSD